MAVATVITKKPVKADAVSTPVRIPTAVLQFKASPRRSTPRFGRTAPPATTLPAGASKQAHLIALLQAGPGATINQMMPLTSWQAHTVRGTISGVLRKKLGLNVTCQAASDSGDRAYRIVG